MKEMHDYLIKNDWDYQTLDYIWFAISIQEMVSIGDEGISIQELM